VTQEEQLLMMLKPMLKVSKLSSKKQKLFFRKLWKQYAKNVDSLLLNLKDLSNS